MRLTFATLKYITCWPPLIHYQGFSLGDIVGWGSFGCGKIISFDIGEVRETFCNKNFV